MLSDAERSAAMLAVLEGGLGAIAASISVPVLQHFADGVGASGRVLTASARAQDAAPRIAELTAAAEALVGRDDEVVGALVRAGQDGVEGAAELLRELLAAEARVETGSDSGGAPAPAAPAQLGTDAVAAYLRARFNDPAAEVHEVAYVGGGYSKHTILVTMTVGGDRREVVLRQVPDGQPDDSLAPEYEVLRRVHSPALPIAEPLWIEPATGELGGPFFASARAHGTTLGDVERAHGDVPASFCEDLARFLATVHGLELPAGLVTPVPPMRTADEIRTEIEASVARTRQARGTLTARQSAVRAWLHANIPSQPSAQVIHGDVGLHNCLAVDGRLTAVLDWERAHLGDPAEDLAYVRPSIEPHYPWADFLALYVSHGGPAPDPAALRFYTVWQDFWRHVECVRLGEDFFGSASLPMLIAGFVLAPRFLASALSTAFPATEDHTHDR